MGNGQLEDAASFTMAKPMGSQIRVLMGQIEVGSYVVTPLATPHESFIYR